MKNRILHIVVWLLIIAWFVLIMGFVSGSNKEVLCKNIEINIEDSTDVSFVESEMIRDLLKEAAFHLQGYPSVEIPTREIEDLLEDNPYVKSAEVYVNIEGEMHVDIEQRKPLFRVMPDGKKGFYIDQEAHILPLSESFSPMVLLVSGNLSQNLLLDEDQGVLKNSDFAMDLLNLAIFINEHPFWSQQVVQLYRAENGDYEIIPRVGAHQIVLGSIDNAEEKFRNLELLYKQGFSKTGWNRYNRINLKYSNQIICTKR